MLWIAMALMLAQPGGTEAPEAPGDVEAMQAASDEWQACTIREAEPMALRTKEMADVIVTSALSFCWKEDDRMLVTTQMYLEGQRGSAAGAAEMVRTFKDTWRVKLVAAIIKLRSRQ